MCLFLEKQISISTLKKVFQLKGNYKLEYQFTLFYLFSLKLPHCMMVEQVGHLLASHSYL